MVKLSVKLAGLELANPIMNSSGTLGLGDLPFLDHFKLGALVTKGVTLEPRKGNPVPRLAEVPGGLINSIGLENLGIERFLEDDLPEWLKFGVPVIVNISGATPEEYRQLAQALSKTGIAAIEVNVSCPNIEGKIIGADPYQTALVTQAVKQSTHLPVIVKLTPNVADIVTIARSAVEAGANALSAVNTFMAMDIDPRTGRLKIGRGFGGMSGPAILPQALYKVWQVCQAVKVPVIGMGGISCAEDAIKFFRVGASAVAIGTTNFTNRQVMAEIISGIRNFLERLGCQGIQEISGKMEFPRK